MKRQHKISILKYVKGKIWLLILPLLRGLLSEKMDLNGWIKNAYMDIIVILFLITYAVLRWWSVQYEIFKKGIYVKSGIVFRQETFIPYEAISCVTAYSFFLARPFRAVRISVDSESKSVSKKHNPNDFELYLSETEYSLLCNYIPYKNSNIKISYKASKRELVFFSLLFSSALSGIIFIGTTLIQGSRIAGRSVEENLTEFVNEVGEASEKIFGGAVPVSVALTLLLAAGWMISFIKNLLRHMCFRLKRCGKKIIVENGVFSSWKYYVNYSRINYADLQQNMLMKICKVMSLHVSCTGYGKNKNELPVLVPVTGERRVMSTIRTMLPDFTQSNILIRPAARSIVSYVLLPAAAVLLIPIAGVVLREFFHEWEEIIIFLTIMGEIPSIYLLAVKNLAHFVTGIGAGHKNLTLKYCRMYDFHTVIVPKERIAYVKIRRTLFQRASGCCDMVFYTCGERVRAHKIKGIKYVEAENLVSNYDKMC